MSTGSLLLTNALLTDPAARTQMHGALLIKDGVIADLGPGLTKDKVGSDVEILDCGGEVLAPGLVDMRAVTGEPGAEHRETLATASQAAAAGGVTTVVCTPETHPPIDDPAIVDFVLRRARDTSIVHIHAMAALTKGLAGQEMTEIGLLGEAGALAFTDGAHSVMNARVLRRTLTYARDFDALVVHHTQDADLAGDGVMNEGEFASRLGLPGIPAEAEAMLLERDMRLVAMTGARYHAATVTCRASLDVLRRAKADGLTVTASTSINHVTLNENDIGAFRTFCKVSPPLRHEDDRIALVQAVKDGLVDAIVSDHNPQDVETKRQPFAECADGAIGLETMLSAGLRLVHDGSLDLLTLLRALSTRPAEILRLPGGTLTKGAPADLVVFDPDTPFVLDAAKLKSRCKNSPFDGARLQGQVSRTIVAGRLVYQI
ncbi:dihydroorotase [Labrys miyagiensis]|uniref:Dihydroorotase n=1 Tax=Labrys miyagiensis TaxID=346912 RepID=A0ABQ6CF41_9HYPH|nr:dihydroorotase [Labrys miyagiensis]GLS18992.1 dihydroorotase [Labrys miyagiensis]